VTFQSARALADRGDWNGAVDRLFSACEYALKAILGHHGLQAKGHSGREQLMHVHLVRPGLIEPRLARIYRTLSEERHKASYEDGIWFDADTTGPLIEQAEEFVAALRHLG
jgi:uncharacterized protein (UPF0332 family)